MRAVDGKPQIFVLPLQAGGEAWALTKFSTGAGNPRWSPDGRQIAFTSELSYDEVRKLEPDAKPALSPERAGRVAHDTALWPRKEKAKGDAASPNDAPLPSARPDGSRAEQREWLAKNEAVGNPRLLTRLDFLGEAGLEPALTFTQLYVADVRDSAEPQRRTAATA